MAAAKRNTMNKIDNRFNESASMLLTLFAAYAYRSEECVLSQARDNAGGNCGVSLVDFAKYLGFTEIEAWDIMSGWDGSSWNESSKSHDAPGYILGATVRLNTDL